MKSDWSPHSKRSDPMEIRNCEIRKFHNLESPERGKTIPTLNIKGCSPIVFSNIMVSVYVLPSPLPPTTHSPLRPKSKPAPPNNSIQTSLISHPSNSNTSLPPPPTNKYIKRVVARRSEGGGGLFFEGGHTVSSIRRGSSMAGQAKLGQGKLGGNFSSFPTKENNIFCSKNSKTISEDSGGISSRRSFNLSSVDTDIDSKTYPQLSAGCEPIMRRSSLVGWNEPNRRNSFSTKKTRGAGGEREGLSSRREFDLSPVDTSIDERTYPQLRAGCEPFVRRSSSLVGWKPRVLIGSDRCCNPTETSTLSAALPLISEHETLELHNLTNLFSTEFNEEKYQELGMIGMIAVKVDRINPCNII